MVAHRRLLLKQKFLLLLFLYKRHQKRKSRYEKDRQEKGEFQTLARDLCLFDEVYFYWNFRMSLQRFEQILSWVGPHIAKYDIKRPCTQPAERLIITLLQSLCNAGETVAKPLGMV